MWSAYGKSNVITIYPMDFSCHTCMNDCDCHGKGKSWYSLRQIIFDADQKSQRPLY